MSLRMIRTSEIGTKLPIAALRHHGADIEGRTDMSRRRPSELCGRLGDEIDQAAL